MNFIKAFCEKIKNKIYNYKEVIGVAIITMLVGMIVGIFISPKNMYLGFGNDNHFGKQDKNISDNGK